MTATNTNAKSWMPALMVATGKVLLLPAVLVLIGFLWLSVALGGGSPKWIEHLVLVSPVAFTAYWLLGWRPRDYRTARRILLGITVLLLLPALILVFALEPWQRAQMQRHNALVWNQSHLDSALEQHVCPNGSILVVTPWLFIVDGEAPRRLVELRVVPLERNRHSLVLARTTALRGLARQPALASEHEAVVECLGDAYALEDLLERMADGRFE